MDSVFRLKKSWYLILLVILFTAIVYDSVFAVPLSGDLPDIKVSDQDLKKDLDQYLAKVEQQLKIGELEQLGALASRLQRIDPDNDNLNALYGIYLASQGFIDTAKKELASVSSKNKYALYAEAMILRHNKEFESALKTCEQAISLDKKHPFPYNVMGGIYYDMNKIDQAIKSFKKAIHLSSGFYPAYTNTGFAYLKTGDLKTAADYFKKAIGLKKETASPHYGLALIHEKRGEIDLAITEAQKSIDIKATRNPAMIELAQIYITQQRLDDALKIGKEMKVHGYEDADRILAQVYLQMGDAQKVLEYAGKLPEGHNAYYYYRAWGFLLKLRYRDALRLFESIAGDKTQDYALYMPVVCINHYLHRSEAIELPLKMKWSPIANKLLAFINGSIYITDKNDWKKALESWKNSEGLFPAFSLDGLPISLLKQNTTESELRDISIGLLFFANNTIKSSQTIFSQALEKNKSSILANYMMAQVQFRLKNFEQAISYLKTALAQAPDFYSALHFLGALELVSGNVKQAQTYMIKALNIKKDPILLATLCQSFEDSGDIKKAKHYYQVMIDTYPDNYVAYNQMAYFLADSNQNLDKALKLAKNANRLSPHNPLVLDTLGWVYYKKKDYKNALKYLENSEKITQVIPVVMFHLGVVHHAAGSNAKAKQYLEKALKISDRFQEAEQAKELLANIK